MGINIVCTIGRARIVCVIVGCALWKLVVGYMLVAYALCLRMNKYALCTRIFPYIEVMLSGVRIVCMDGRVCMYGVNGWSGRLVPYAMRTWVVACVYYMGGCMCICAYGQSQSMSTVAVICTRVHGQ